MTAAQTAVRVAARETDIVVPAGVSHYHIAQRAGKRQHTFHLHEPESKLRLTATVHAAGEARPDLTITILHHATHSHAEIEIRTLAREKGAARFTGLLRIEPDCPGVSSYLTHHSLLLGDDAASWTTPSLEILTDDVHCSHSAIVRTITPLDLFYLASRGVSASEATDLLTTTFLTHVPR
jgi:Fe-S cluster assembly scaffold protein SufB